MLLADYTRVACLTWNKSVFSSTMYSTMTAWFLDSVYEMECCCASSTARSFCAVRTRYPHFRTTPLP